MSATGLGVDGLDVTAADSAATAGTYTQTIALANDYSGTSLDFAVGGTNVSVSDDLSGATDAAITTALNNALTAAGINGDYTASYASGAVTFTTTATGAAATAPALTGDITGGTGTAGANASGASAAIDLLDAAVQAVSATRGELGALQNRFEHTINNLNVAVENLSASESRIRDTDMASEMMEFTRTQILSQAGTAMLAQANQAPQGVLALLR